MNPTIEELTVAVEREARKRPEAPRLMTHPGVGPLTALAQRGKQIGAYVGLIPCEDSSAREQRLGHIRRQFLVAFFGERGMGGYPGSHIERN